MCWRRWPLSFFLYAAVTVVVAASSEFWGSFERYAYGAFPIVFTVAAADPAAWLERTVLVLSREC